LCAEIDPLLMMRPPCGVWSRIMRKAALAHRNIAFRLTATTCCQPSHVMSPKLVVGTLPPALLNSMSTRPNFSFTAANKAATCAGSVTSVGTASVVPPVARLAVSSSIAARRPARATDQPSFNRAKAEARPMPLPAPVMTATRFAILRSLPR